MVGHYLICLKVFCDNLFEQRRINLSSYDSKDDEEKNRNSDLEDGHEPVAPFQQQVFPQKHKKLWKRPHVRSHRICSKGSQIYI